MAHPVDLPLPAPPSFGRTGTPCTQIQKGHLAPTNTVKLKMAKQHDSRFIYNAAKVT
jgi:hypothetical protein